MDAIKEIDDEYRAKLNEWSKEKLISAILHLTKMSFGLDLLNKQLIIDNKNLKVEVEMLKATTQDWY